MAGHSYGVTNLSTHNRTNANSKAPVSSHPLFPVIVALWFGALFGLGSLAVRVSLIESLIISVISTFSCRWLRRRWA